MEKITHKTTSQQAQSLTQLHAKKQEARKNNNGICDVEMLPSRRSRQKHQCG